MNFEKKLGLEFYETFLYNFGKEQNKILSFDYTFDLENTSI
jgi:hypothetical protein